MVEGDSSRFRKRQPAVLFHMAKRVITSFIIYLVLVSPLLIPRHQEQLLTFLDSPMALFRRSTGGAKPNRVFFLHSSTLTPVFSTKNYNHPHFIDALAIWETRKYKLRLFEMGFQFLTNFFGVFSAQNHLQGQWRNKMQFLHE